MKSFISAMRGVPLDYPSLDQEDEASLERYLRAEPERALAAALYFIRKTQAKVFLRDEALALASAVEARALVADRRPRTSRWWSTLFYSAPRPRPPPA